MARTPVCYNKHPNATTKPLEIPDSFATASSMSFISGIELEGNVGRCTDTSSTPTPKTSSVIRSISVKLENNKNNTSRIREQDLEIPPKTPPHRVLNDNDNDKDETPTGPEDISSLSPSLRASRTYSFSHKDFTFSSSKYELRLLFHNSPANVHAQTPRRYHPANPSSIYNSPFFGDVTRPPPMFSPKDSKPPPMIRDDPTCVVWPQAEDKTLFAIMNGNTQYKIATSQGTKEMWSDIYRAFRTELPDSKKTKQELREYWIAHGGRDLVLNPSEVNMFALATEDIEEEDKIRLIIYRFHQLTSKWLAYPAAKRHYNDIKHHQKKMIQEKHKKSLKRTAKRAEKEDTKSTKRRKTEAGIAKQEKENYL